MQSDFLPSVISPKGGGISTERVLKTAMELLTQMLVEAVRADKPESLTSRIDICIDDIECLLERLKH